METFKGLYEGGYFPGNLRKQLVKHAGEDVLAFFTPFFSLQADHCAVFKTGDYLNIEFLDRKINEIINLEKVNNVRFVNKFFEAVNSKLFDSGYVAGCVETYAQRRLRISRKHSRIFAYPYSFIDFVFKRVVPKWKPTRKLYYKITSGNNRVISRAELYGRLYSCGFKFVAEKEINNLLYFIFRKKSVPAYDQEPTYGPLIKLRRIGKGAKEIRVYKLRTMYAFSEYLQEFVYENHDLDHGGKFKDDFRVTTWGRLMRKLWIDELPMLYNFVKGQMKIVGVRPLSRHYFSLYSEEMRKRRIQYKPGLLPPYYADMPKTFQEIMESEKRYFDAYDKHPFFTDIKYFFKATKNIFLKRARSK